MCGRFSLGTTDLKAEYDLITEVKLEPRYNVAPGTEVPVIVEENGKNKLIMMKWGFEFDSREGKTMQVINAKGETLHEKNMFKGLIETKRCLIPATGFYEWQRKESIKIPYYIFIKERSMFSFGGIYRTEKSQSGEQVNAAVIITTEPNELMVPIHNRMPLILDKHNEQLWLSNKPYSEIAHLIRPYPASEMDAYTISRDVNSPRVDNPGILEHFTWDIAQQ